MINIGQYRSDAIIILQDVGDPVIVPLPESLPIYFLLSSQFATACASHGKGFCKTDFTYIEKPMG